TSIGVYTVTVTNQEGCTGTAMVEVSATPCLAEAGVLTTNQNTICVGGDLEISSTGNQIGSNYRHYFFVYSQDNLGNTLYQKSAIANYGTGTAKASFGGLSAGDYLVCSYNECKDCLPNPSPVIFTTPMNDIYQTGTIQDGCFDIECVELTVPEAFEPNTAGTGIVAENNAAGQTIFVAEVCGGTMPYSIEFEKSGGFALVNDYPSPIAGCLKYQVLYVPEADWTLTVTDANNCNNETVVFTNEDLIDESEPQIVSHEIDLESCPGYADGSISIEVEGGSDGCNEYTYQWSGPNSFTSTALGEVTGNEATGLASGKYDVTVTDCTGTTATLEDINVTRKTRGRGGRGGCKTVEGQENRMLGVYPNPFGAQTSIEFILAESSKVWLSVYSMDGRKVAELLQGEEVEGELLQRMDFDAEQLQNGAYILKLQTESGERFYEKLMVNK
ncbi:MAG: T9SS type A sorting domain-containing protein, partial [Chitinophagales bacterium]